LASTGRKTFGFESRKTPTKTKFGLFASNDKQHQIVTIAMVSHSIVQKIFNLSFISYERCLRCHTAASRGVVHLVIRKMHAVPRHMAYYGDIELISSDNR